MTGSVGTSTRVPAASDLVGTFGALQSLLLTAQGVDAFLGELAVLAAGAMPFPASCGITVRLDGRPLTVGSSDERAEQLDEAQFGAGHGPCLDSLTTGAVQDVPDLTTETRWADYRPRAMRVGVRSSLSIPLEADGRTIGALNLYGFTAQAFVPAVRQHAEAVAAQAAGALTLALRRAAKAEERVQLEAALVSRTIIDQALGILMAQQRCTAEDAFVLLRAHSQNNNRKLREVALDLVTRVTGHPPTPVHAFDRRPSRS